MDETLNEVEFEGVLEFHGKSWLAALVTSTGGTMMLRPACLLAESAVGRALVSLIIIRMLMHTVRNRP